MTEGTCGHTTLDGHPFSASTIESRKLSKVSYVAIAHGVRSCRAEHRFRQALCNLPAMGNDISPSMLSKLPKCNSVALKLMMPVLPDFHRSKSLEV